MFCNGPEGWGPVSPTRVDLTLCFEDTIFLALPSFLFTLAFIHQVYHLSHSGRTPFKYGHPSPWIYWPTTLSLIGSILALIARTVVILTQPGTTISIPATLATVCLLMACVAAVFMNHAQHKYEIRSSSYLSAFLAFNIVVGIVNIHTIIDTRDLVVDDASNNNKQGYTNSLIPFCVCFAFLCIAFCADTFFPRNSTLVYQDGANTFSPYEKANLFSRLVFHYIQPIISIGYRRNLTLEDIANTMPATVKTINSFEPLDHQWRHHLLVSKANNKKPSLVWVLMQYPGWAWVPVLSFLLLDSALTYLLPELLNQILAFIANSDVEDGQSKPPISLGLLLAIAMFVTAVMMSILDGQYMLRALKIGLTLQTGVTSMIFRKALVISNGSKQDSTVGDTANLLSVDAESMSSAITYLPIAVSLPFELCLGIWLLYRQLGVSIFAGLFLVFLVSPLQGLVAKYLNNFSTKKLSFLDERIRLLSEVLSGIKIVKLYAWEVPFLQKLTAIRQLELYQLKLIGATYALMMIMYTSLPSMMTLVSFTVYTLVGGPGGTPGELNSQVVFVSLSLFGRLSKPMGRVSSVISEAIKFKVAVGRIQKFLEEEEIDSGAVLVKTMEDWKHNREERLEKNKSSCPVIEFQDGTFSWQSKNQRPSESTPELLDEKKENDNETGNEKQMPEHDNINNTNNTPVLSDINLAIQRGHLTAVVGRIGQGKSSLASAILGDTCKLSGKVTRYGSIAYVPQQAWIMNSTLRENILFGKPYDKELYDNIILATSLVADLEMLPAGDMTEIGERGINLSGGQKQRVSLARAAYQDADIYLLDDPLSAVDAHVDQHLWEALIGPRGIWGQKQKTRVLITHGLHHLQEVDQVVVLKDGRVLEQGTLKELLSNEDGQERGEFSKLMNEQESQKKKSKTRKTTRVGEEHEEKYGVEDQQNETEEEQLSSIDHCSITSSDSIESKAKTIEAAEEDNKESDGKLVEAEEVPTGSMVWRVYKQYAKATTYTYAIITFIGFMLSQGTQIGTNVWLQYYSDNTETASKISVGVFLGVYGALVASYILLDAGVNYLTFAIAGYRASEVLHDKLLAKVMRLPMAFFDQTPLGRLQNRFSSDVSTLDEYIPYGLSDTFYYLASVLGTMVVISTSLPIFLAFLPLLFIPYLFVQRRYLRTSQGLKRLYSISKSPLYNHFGETLAGVSTIRSMSGQTARFILENSTRSDTSANASMNYTMATKWLQFRLEILGSTVIFATALLAVLSRSNLNAGQVGLALTYSLNMTNDLSWFVKTFCELSNYFVSVERMQEYCDLNPEAPAMVDEKDVQLPNDWPSKGEVEFRNYSTRYRQGLELVIKGMSFKVAPKEKIGIVGRTGAGKSSLTLALFRIIEAADSALARACYNRPSTLSTSGKVASDISFTDRKDKDLCLIPEGINDQTFTNESSTLIDGGSIWIDGVDISTIGLHQLRSRLAIIPQDPTLFAGTVRENLDPFNEMQDADLWEALERAHLKGHISSLTGGLQFKVSQGGDNFSVGQRSLICLARALLRKAKVLILDEATSAVDIQTDELIQKTIRSEFKDRTILTIAHRLKTVMDSDKILVMDKGQVEEFEPPAVLLQREESLFYKLAEQAGEIKKED